MVPQRAARRQITAGPRDSDALVARRQDGRVRPRRRAAADLAAADGGRRSTAVDGHPARRVGLRVVAERPLDRVHVDHARSDIDKKKDAEEPSDVRVITISSTGAMAWVRRAGPAELHLGGRRARGGRRGPESAPVDDRRVQRGDIVWSKDGSKTTTSNRAQELYYNGADNDVYAVNASGGEPVKIASIDGPIRQLALSLDGARLAFVGSINRGADVGERSYSQPDLFVTRVEATRRAGT